MKNIWKWIVGIVVLLLVMGAVVAIPIKLHMAMGVDFTPGSERQPHDFDGRGYDKFGPMMDGCGYDKYGPMMDGRGYDKFGPMMDGRGYDKCGPMMDGRGHGKFGALFVGFVLLGGLLHLLVLHGIVAFIAWFAYQQGKKAGMKAISMPAPAPTPEEPAL